jgi:hypothetical protein
VDGVTCSDSALVLELHVDDEERGRTGDVDDWNTMPSWQETVAAAMVLVVDDDEERGRTGGVDD